MSRAAFLAMTAATSLALTECSGETTVDPGGGYGQPLYGATSPIATTSDSGASDSGDGRVVADASVGDDSDASPNPAPEDAGKQKDAGDGETKDGGPYAQPLYGAFPIGKLDAGLEHDSGEPVVTLYGGFPHPLPTNH